MWLGFNLPRVLAVAPNGRIGWQAGNGRTPLDEIRTKALDRCAANGTKGCTLYAENLQVVMPGRTRSPPPVPGQGDIGRMNTQINELRGIFDKMPPSQTRVAIVQFDDDRFAADPGWRAEMIQINQPRLGGVLPIDRSEGFRGHLAGESETFGLRFGPCLLRFATGEATACPR